MLHTHSAGAIPETINRLEDPNVDLLTAVVLCAAKDYVRLADTSDEWESANTFLFTDSRIEWGAYL